MSQVDDAEKLTEAEFHRKVAVDCFNKTWDYLDKKDRTPADETQMLLVAHASRYHWSLIGNASNFAMGDWQLSRVYAGLKQPDLAVLFAKSALDLCEKNDLSDMFLSAHEGMARAYAVANDSARARDYVSKARMELKSVTNEEDKKIYEDQIKETEELIK